MAILSGIQRGSKAATKQQRSPARVEGKAKPHPEGPFYRDFRWPSFKCAKTKVVRMVTSSRVTISSGIICFCIFAFLL